MALIKCEDCGKEISDKASACIHCGCPVENTKEDDYLDEEELDEDEEYETSEDDEELDEEEYEEEYESWYDLPDDRKEELKEEFYKKIGSKPDDPALVFLGGFGMGAFGGLLLCAATDVETSWWTSIITLGVCSGFFWLALARRENRKLDGHFTSWLKHSKGIYKSKE